MRTISLPEPSLLREVPERGPLLLLLAALDVADSSLRVQHPRIDIDPVPPVPALPPTELLAELLVARFAELQALVTRYNDAVNDAIGLDEPSLNF
jgi:hypothetical protein